jgi:hypothetical protein
MVAEVCKYKKNFLGTSSGAGDGSRVLYGPAEPEPKEIFTAPQHCLYVREGLATYPAHCK